MSGPHSPPLAVDVRSDRLVLTWGDGQAVLRADTLRSACRCGGCRGAAMAGRAAQPAVAGVELVQVEAAGAYGLQLIFSDGHDRGIYPWSLMRELAA